MLDVLPGLTDYATLEYIDEQKIIGEADDPEKAYIQEVMPAKLQLNLKYVEKASFIVDISLIFKTIFKIFLVVKKADANYYSCIRKCMCHLSKELIG